MGALCSCCASVCSRLPAPRLGFREYGRSLASVAGSFPHSRAEEGAQWWESGLMALFAPALNALLQPLPLGGDPPGSRAVGMTDLWRHSLSMSRQRSWVQNTSAGSSQVRDPSLQISVGTLRPSALSSLLALEMLLFRQHGELNCRPRQAPAPAAAQPLCGSEG